jgi:hypothetical protein
MKASRSTLASTLAVLAALSLTACDRSGDQTAAGDSSTNPPITAPSGSADTGTGAAGDAGAGTGGDMGAGTGAGTTAPGTITPESGGGTSGSADTGATGGAAGDATTDSTERERNQ